MQTQALPEELGPGQYADNGSVSYGAQDGLRAGAIPPPRDREPGLDANVVRDDGHPCPQCAGIPRETLASLQAAFAQVPGAGARR
jgi:hypothetical protein